MATLSIRQLLQENFPELTEPELIHQIITHGKLYHAEPGDKIMGIGSYIKTMPLLVNGSIKVIREDEEGREIFLYYLQPGETCAMSLTCCLANERSEIKAIAEEDSEMIMLPVGLMDTWMLKYRSWRNFVMNTYRRRFDELLHTIDSIAFHKMDERLWNYLIDTSSALNSRMIQTTHQAIAYELNSTREVISRLLKQLEKQSKVKLGRNKITLLH